MDLQHCAAAPTVEKLKNAQANLQCALARMQLLVSRDRVLSGENHHGAAAYWSVLREPYQEGALFLGRKPHIQLFTRSYRGYREP